MHRGLFRMSDVWLVEVGQSCMMETMSFCHTDQFKADTVKCLTVEEHVVFM